MTLSIMMRRLPSLPVAAALFGAALLACTGEMGEVTRTAALQTQAQRPRTASPIDPIASGGEPLPGDDGEPIFAPSLRPAAEGASLTCGPTAGGPYWMEEGESLVVKLHCRNGTVAGSVDFDVSALPRGADFDRGEKELRWTPALDQAGVYAVDVMVAGTSERTTLKIGVADRFDLPENVPFASAAEYQEEMGLPVFHLNVSPEINADGHTPASLVYRGKSYVIEAKHRGRSSLVYPMKNYTLKFPKGAPFSDPERAGGFVNKRRVVLVNSFDDNSFSRQRLAYEAWNRLGTIRIQTYSAIVYLNGRYEGLYTAADSVDEDLMAASGLPGEGSLYKAIDHDASFRSDVPPGEVFERKEGPTVEGEPEFADLTDLIEFIANSDVETFRSKIDERLDLRDYTAWMIVASALLATDSLAKNAYHYLNPKTGLWKVAPWDFNASWGQDWDTRRLPATIDPIDMARGANRLFARLFDDDVLGVRTRDRYAEAIANQLSLEEVEALLERILEEVTPSAARNERRWRKSYVEFDRWKDRTDFNDFAGEVAYLKGWIKERWKLLNERF